MYYGFGLLCQDHHKDYERADRYFRRALAVDPADATTLSARGLLLHTHKRDADAAGLRSCGHLVRQFRTAWFVLCREGFG